MKYVAVFNIPDELIYDANNLYCGAVVYEGEFIGGKEIASFEQWKLNEYKEIQKWIPCTERLPEECVNCLGWIDRECWVDGNDYPTRKQETAIGWHIDGRWHFDGYSSNTKCIAWMPLPEPYKKEGGADNEMQV